MPARDRTTRIDPTELERLARLAQIHLTEDESRLLTGELDVILTHFQTIRSAESPETATDQTNTSSDAKTESEQ